MTHPAEEIFNDITRSEGRNRIYKSHGLWVAECPRCRTAWVHNTHSNALKAMATHFGPYPQCTSWKVFYEWAD